MTVAISDVIVPPAKKDILAETSAAVKKVETYFSRGIITEKERYDKVCALWNTATDRVAQAMMDNMDEFNPIYMMSKSGARGNPKQMRQLAGMRGLMADPSGKIIDLPITANFREGLSVSDYFISSHGARKGLADTALRTADSGYLTRRLVDVAQDVIVRQDDCSVTTINLQLIRARLAEDTFDALEILNDLLIGKTMINDGEDVVLDEESLVKLGEQSVTEIELRGTTLTAPLAANHTSVTEIIKLGTRDDSARQLIRDSFIAELVGKELLPNHLILTADMINDLLDDDTITTIDVRLQKIRGIEVEAIREDTRNADKSKGVIESLADRITGRVLAEDIFDSDGTLIAHLNDMIDDDLADKIASIRDKVLIRSVLTCQAPQGVCRKCYGQDLANKTDVEIGEAVGIIAAQSIGEPGTQLTMRTFHTGGVAGGDITQGLPRVEELFEARKPKMCAIIAEIDGTISYGEPDKNNLRTIVITPDDPENQLPREYSIPFGITPKVKEGDRITAGSLITDHVDVGFDHVHACVKRREKCRHRIFGTVFSVTSMCSKNDTGSIHYVTSWFKKEI